MTDKLKVRVPNPMANCGLGTGEEVIEDCDFMSENHQTVDKMGTNETSATGDKDALALGRREELHGWEAREGGVRDRLSLGVVDRLGLVGDMTFRELSV